MSRTFPDATCWASGMDRFLLAGLDERVQTREDGVDVARVGAEVEDGVEVDAAGDLVVGAAELGEVELLVQARIALRWTSRYASSRGRPASTSASSTRWL